MDGGATSSRPSDRWHRERCRRGRKQTGLVAGETFERIAAQTLMAATETTVGGDVPISGDDRREIHIQMHWVQQHRGIDTGSQQHQRPIEELGAGRARRARHTPAPAMPRVGVKERPADLGDEVEWYVRRDLQLLDR